MALNVLVIEDDADTQEVMRTFLEMEGHSVCTAADIASALAIVVKWQPNVALLDYSLRDLNPEDFIKRARMKNPDLCIILVSAIPNLAEKARHLGLDLFISKPFLFEDLTKVINDCLTPIKAAS